MDILKLNIAMYFNIICVYSFMYLLIFLIWQNKKQSFANKFLRMVLLFAVFQISYFSFVLPTLNLKVELNVVFISNIVGLLVSSLIFFYIFKPIPVVEKNSKEENKEDLEKDKLNEIKLTIDKLDFFIGRAKRGKGKEVVDDMLKLSLRSDIEFALRDFSKEYQRKREIKDSGALTQKYFEEFRDKFNEKVATYLIEIKPTLEE